MHYDRQAAKVGSLEKMIYQAAAIYAAAYLLFRIPEYKSRKEVGFLETVQLVVFSLGKEEYAVNIGQAQEIIRIPEQIIGIPSMPSHIEGIVNLRDKVLPVIDIKKSFGYAASERNEDSRLLILDLDNTLAGIIVDDVSEVLKLDEKAVEKLGAELSGAGCGCLYGIARLEGRMIMLLDALKLKTKFFNL